MSSSNISGFPRSIGKTLFQYKNAHGTAPVIWDYLCNKYTGKSWLFDSDKLWALDKDPRLEPWERDCLILTYDWALLKQEYIPRIIESLNKMYAATYKEGYVNHLKKLAEDLGSKEAQKCAAIGFNWTSVCEDYWIGYNFKTKTDHWFLFEEVDKYPNGYRP